MIPPQEERGERPDKQNMVIVALQLVSFIKNLKVLPGKFTLKYWIYLLMQSKIDLRKRITNAISYQKICYEKMLKTKVLRMSLKPFLTISQNSSKNNFRNNLNNFLLYVCRQVKDQGYPSLLDVVKQMNTYERAHISKSYTVIQVNISLTGKKCFKSKKDLLVYCDL